MKKGIQYLFYIQILSIFFVSFYIKPEEVDNGISEKRIIVVAASYNNKDWYKMCLDSIFNQKYSNWEIIYIDDCSTDGSGDLVEEYIIENGFKNKVNLIRNKKRAGTPIANQYKAIHSCSDRDIIVILDGDDWLAHDQVFSYINNVYSDSNIWMTYGQFQFYSSGNKGFCKSVPKNVIKENSFRKFGYVFSHLRTFYAGLFKKIKKADLMNNGKFFEIAVDVAIMFPMIEMARDGHFKFVSEVLHIYNDIRHQSNPKRRATLSRSNEKIIRKRKPYNKLGSPFRDCNIIRA